MKLFIFEDIEHVSHHYHSNWGLMVIAKDRHKQFDMVIETLWTDDIKITEDEWKSVIEYDVWEVEPKVIVFPDSWCC
jgi:hypothetical protein